MGGFVAGHYVDDDAEYDYQMDLLREQQNQQLWERRRAEHWHPNDPEYVEDDDD